MRGAEIYRQTLFQTVRFVAREGDSIHSKPGFSRPLPGLHRSVFLLARRDLIFDGAPCLGRIAVEIHFAAVRGRWPTAFPRERREIERSATMSGEPNGTGTIPPPSPGNNSVASGLTAASGSVVSAGTSASAAPSQTTTPLRNASGGQQQQQQQFTAATAAALAPAWPNLSSGGGVPSSPVARTNTANANANAMPGTPLQQTKAVLSAQQQGTPLVAAASPGAPYASPGPAAAGGGGAVNITTPMRAPQNTAGAAAALSSPSNASQQQQQQQSQPQTIGPPPPTPVQPHPGAPPPLVPSLSTQTSASAASTEQGVALGVEALERQQALVEQRRASAAAVVRQRQAQFQAQQAQQQQAQQQLQARNQQQQQARHPQAPPSIPAA